MMHLLVSLAALPWLQGFQPVAVGERASHQVASQMAEWRAPDAECVGSAYGGIQITADLAAPSGDETVLASYSQGVMVIDASRHLIAQTPGFECTGSADELVALAAGEAWIGTPVLALAATRGGRAENVTWLSLYRVGDSGQLEPIFTGAVEQHTGHATRTGTISLFPGGLVYRPPTGATTIWLYDPVAKRYVQQGEFETAA